MADRAGEGVKPATLRKETATLRMLLYRTDRLLGTGPGMDVRAVFKAIEYPKAGYQPPFVTLDEARRLAAGLAPEAAKEVWDRVFPSPAEVEQVLDWAAGQCLRVPAPYLVPLLTAIAHTGARLSELTRSRVEDWDLAGRAVLLREKKKSQTADTFRRVDLSPRLVGAMTAWLGPSHPGGGFAFCRTPGRRLTSQGLYQLFVTLTKRGPWKLLRGYHVFRHSAASNMAAAGVDDRVIDAVLGHLTPAMRRRYQHLRPEQKRSAMAAVYGG